MIIKGLPEKYRACAELMGKRLSLDTANVTLRFEEAEGMRVSFDGGEGVIACNSVNRFARLLGIFASKYKSGAFSVTESASFDTLSCMLDVSFNSPLTVESVKEFLEYMALFGFNQLQFYIEDMYEIEGRPYFGHFRGRYTYGELKEIDDYADLLGIEVVPCMQTLGHMSQYLKWAEASDVKDTAGVLLCESEKTYEFIEQMILASSAPFRSKKIHVGCDETYGLGTGKYFKLHGKADVMDLYLNHIAKVADICKKHGLSPMMWSDMLCSSFSKGGGNWNPDIQIPDYVRERLPENMQLVLWHYGQIKGAEGYMVPKHRALGKEPMVAGASHIWQSYLPDYNFSLMATESTLCECKRLGIREVMITLWNYRKCVYQAALLDLCQYGELTYRDDCSELKERFEFLTGASYDAFLRMSDLSVMYKNEEDKKRYQYGRNETGNAYILTDILLNVLEKEWLADPREGHYAKGAEYFRPLAEKEGKWQFLYKYCYALFDMMRLKSAVVERLSPAYKSGDRETLAALYEDYLPAYLDSLEELSEAHAYHKDTYLRPFGAELNDASYGKMKERAKTAIRRLGAYLDGRIDSLSELEDERLPYQWGIFF